MYVYMDPYPYLDMGLQPADQNVATLTNGLPN